MNEEKSVEGLKKEVPELTIQEAIAKVEESVEELKASNTQVKIKKAIAFMAEENKVELEGVTIYAKGKSFHVVLADLPGNLVIANVVLS